MSSNSPSAYIDQGALKIHKILSEFVEGELLPGLKLDAADYWRGVEKICHELIPLNRELLEQREHLQAQIDAWHVERRGQDWQAQEYTQFLNEIGYIVNPGSDFSISTEHVDAEISTIAGPQLVVPVSNARFALNATNARWGSLYDALYGSDVIAQDNGCERAGGYNPKRGAAVIAYAVSFLDQAIPLVQGSHADVELYKLFHQDDITSVHAIFSNGDEVALKQPQKFVGHRSDEGVLGILFKNHNLHIELIIDPDHAIGKTANAHLADVMIEAAITTIQDCEDSVAAVDAADKVGVYRNWLGLMQGNLTSEFKKGGKSVQRTLNPDREYQAVDGSECSLSGRSLLLVRNVGHLMTNNAILDSNDEQIPEGILDAIITVTCALYDLNQQSSLSNSRTGSVYIVKPKMHGPDEVAFADRLFARTEDFLGLKRNTVKIGVMDEERRTTVNLKECIRAVKERLVFINTGFLDRTGDEIHTSMQAGTMLPKNGIKDAVWIDAYERWNVDVGLRCGLPGKAQIGKGMWAKPDELKEMVETKQAHLNAGANCAWVPSPTAATLHALHYHQIYVSDVQAKLAKREHADLGEILTPPLTAVALSDEEIEQELRNSCQTILGYVVRWVDQGVGCSKVPDINNVGLMEDRATLRISSQLLANWLMHGVCDQDRVLSVMKEMAVVVDGQNQHDPMYQAMSDDFSNSVAFGAACDLVVLGADQPSGYTEPLLHERRLVHKSTN